jgi:hypothetical protein
MHPDPDSLNAFVEGALPEHERLQCMAHLAECARCREVVFLAQEPAAAPATLQVVPIRKRWFAPPPLLAAAAALCLAVPAVWLYFHRQHATPASEMFAQVRQAPAAIAETPASSVTAEPQQPKAARIRQSPHTVAALPAPNAMAPKLADSNDLTSATPRPNAPAQPAISSPPAVEMAREKVYPVLPPTIPASSKQASVGMAVQRLLAGSGISGTVTDPNGTAISGATIRLRQLDGTVTGNARTNLTGQFTVGQLPAGRYELQIGALGFRQATQQVDVQPQEVASMKSQLAVASMAETVEVTASAPMVVTGSNSAGLTGPRKDAATEELRPLPSKPPAEIKIVSGKTILILDSVGIVLVSRNSGKSWKSVKPVWTGKVRAIALADPSANADATFQLTTDSGAIWLSRDGTRWRPAPSQR